MTGSCNCPIAGVRLQPTTVQNTEEYAPIKFNEIEIVM